MPEPTFDYQSFLATLSNKSGVYCMFDKEGNVLYVGKARHLKKRVASYFNRSAQVSAKTQALVAQIAYIEVTITHNENEALILENTLIKTQRPRYNILLRDDKSYPYIYLSDHPFPRLTSYRGVKSKKGQYFGPYPHAQAVHESLNLLQKLFLLRDCQDSFYRNRSRPCLQYQIKRCSAPCVQLIDETSYQAEVQHAKLFLQGKSQAIIAALVVKMEAAANALEYEKAIYYRDQINSLQTVQTSQYVSTNEGNVDVVAAIVEGGIGCVQVLMIREGRQVNSHAFFPEHAQDAEVATLLSAFLPQYYLVDYHHLPSTIVLNEAIEDQTLLAAVLSQHHHQQVRLHTTQVRGVRARWVQMALENARASLAQHQPTHYRKRLAALSAALKLEIVPHRLECFDISHLQGEATVAACVVFNREGACFHEYRRFNIAAITAGDDYAALHQAVTRRYARILKENGILPDILFIDGGKGQVTAVQFALAELGLSTLRVIGIAKGENRTPGLETLILPEQETPLILPKHSPAFHLIQQIRDEAHRFALASHRKQRTQLRRQSPLEHIEGIGAVRRQRLINHFGGLQGILRASVEDLARVPGISQQLAQRIYEFLVLNPSKHW